MNAPPDPADEPQASGGLPPAVRDRLEAIYRDVEVEARSLGATCWARGDCCDFNRMDHRLYAGSLEIAHVREKHPSSFPSGSTLCPFWIGGKCTERERRPLGCRTYFCDARYRVQLEDIHERHLARIRRLAAESGLGWSYVEFVAALRSPAAAAAAWAGTQAHDRAPGEAPR